MAAFPFPYTFSLTKPSISKSLTTRHHEDLANLHIIDDKEDAFKEAAAVVEEDYKFCVVGRCLIDNVVHFPSLIVSNCVTFGWVASPLASMKRRMVGLSVTGQSAKPVTMAQEVPHRGLSIRWGTFSPQELARFRKLLKKPVRLKPSWPDDEDMAT
ncbi:hypothetical protein Godav_011017 [Gossypium davidsonii]|uniref:Uncharacterized protein n=1 Tax=Gossypium davidsonii TaxID=34287 RepID=A0A7J8R9V8_GOSDV|nr:hypothetical protein [Gossypium davidsonii]